jgi:hypothetical protein
MFVTEVRAMSLQLAAISYIYILRFKEKEKRAAYCGKVICAQAGN